MNATDWKCTYNIILVITYSDNNIIQIIKCKYDKIILFLNICAIIIVNQSIIINIYVYIRPKLVSEWEMGQ